jgi:chaperonin cofactor prefoldin
LEEARLGETMMDHQDLIAITTIFNRAVRQGLNEYPTALSESGLLDKEEIIAAIAGRLLMEIHESNYKIERK